jgi:hypothetical protein
MRNALHHGFEHGTEEMTPKTLPVALMMIAAAGCGRIDNPTAPSAYTEPRQPSPAESTIDVGGTWVLQNPPGEQNYTTIWILTQSGSNVSGSASRTAPVVLSDRGTVSGIVIGARFLFHWENVTDYGGSGSCALVTTFIDGTLTVSDKSMTGNISSAPQPPCTARGTTGMYTWIRQ